MIHPSCCRHGRNPGGYIAAEDTSLLQVKLQFGSVLSDLSAGTLKDSLDNLIPDHPLLRGSEFNQHTDNKRNRSRMHFSVQNLSDSCRVTKRVSASSRVSLWHTAKQLFWRAGADPAFWSGVEGQTVTDGGGGRANLPPPKKRSSIFETFCGWFCKISCRASPEFTTIYGFFFQRSGKSLVSFSQSHLQCAKMHGHRYFQKAFKKPLCSCLLSPSSINAHFKGYFFWYRDWYLGCTVILLRLVPNIKRVLPLIARGGRVTGGTCSCSSILDTDKYLRLQAIQFDTCTWHEFHGTGIFYWLEIDLGKIWAQIWKFCWALLSR